MLLMNRPGVIYRSVGVTGEMNYLGIVHIGCYQLVLTPKNTSVNRVGVVRMLKYENRLSSVIFCGGSKLTCHPSLFAVIIVTTA